MARIAGIDIPKEKQVWVSLQYIYGIGRTTSFKILEQAGIKPDQQVELKEIPRYKGMFKFKMPSLLGVNNVEDDPVYRYILMLNEHRGRPLPMLAPGTYPSID